MASIANDVVSALRRLLSAPLFTIFAIASLAIGIGATTAIYSTVHAALSPPPGIQDVDDVINIAHWPEGSVPITGISLADFEDYRARQTVLAHVSAWGQMRQMVSGNGQTYTSFGEIVTGDYFALLGVRAAAGRLLQPADDRPGAPSAVVLSYSAWQQLFGGREDAVGAPVRVNGQPFTVVGIAPREFRGQFNNGLTPSAAWLPMVSAPAVLGAGRYQSSRPCPSLVARAGPSAARYIIQSRGDRGHGHCRTNRFVGSVARSSAIGPAERPKVLRK